MSRKKETEQESVNRYRTKWVNRALAKTCHPEKAAEAFKKVYRIAWDETEGDKKPYQDPEIYYCASPRSMFLQLVELYEGDEKIAREDFVISDGAYWCDWRAMYDFEYRNGEMPPRIKAYIEIDRAGAFMWSLYEDLVLFCPPPTVQHFLPRARDEDPLILHCTNGPAFAWEDGCKLYRLNNIEVPEWLVETRAEDLDPKRFAELENVEVRREFIRKVGMERILQHVPHKVLDQKDEYSLLSVDLGTGGMRIYLKMRNPSIGVWHMEAVHPDCATVQEALNWRMNGDKSDPWNPDRLT